MVLDNMYVSYVLSKYRSLNTIAYMLHIDVDTIFDEVFEGREIVMEKWYGNNPFVYISVYKEVK